MSATRGFRPLHDPKALPKGWKKQITCWLEDQGAGTVAQAARDEECRDLWAAEIPVGPRTFHVALTGTGDGAVWEGDDAVPLGDGVRHHGDVRLDADVVQALDAALASAGPPLRIRLSHASPATAPRHPVFAGDLSARLDELEAAFAADSNDRATWRAIGGLVEYVFGRGTRWAPYPKRSFAELDALACWTVVPKEAQIPLTRRRLAYQARLFAWMGVAGFDAWWPERLAAWHGALPAATRDRVGPLDKPPNPRV